MMTFLLVYNLLTDFVRYFMINVLNAGEAKGITLNLENIGRKIKQARLRLKKTQQEVADECNISKSLLSKIENGQTSSAVATLSKISEALDVPLSWLLEETPEQDIVLLRKELRQPKVDDVHMGYSYEWLANRS